jgi:hypothetical protein
MGQRRYPDRSVSALWRVDHHGGDRDRRLGSATSLPVSDLVENNDLIKETNRHYIVGYVVKALSEADLLQPA